MKSGATLALGWIVAAWAAGAGGYWYGKRGAAPAAASAAAAGSVKQEKKILYYRNPMGLPDTSPVPKKDPMGMDYIPVYEGGDDAEPGAANQVRISTDKVQRLGVRTEAAGLRAIEKTVRAAARIEPDERRVYVVSTKFEGFIERLHVNATGQAVGRGQPLFDVYSPELVSAQREYAIAAQGLQAMKDAAPEAQAGMRQLAESSLARLKNWDVSEEQVKALSRSGEARRSLSFRSPVAGIVTEKKAVQGMRVMPGEMLYQIADLSSVWAQADVFEQDIGMVKSGARAKVRINAYPDKEFEGKVAYVYPTLKPETRTMQVRIEMPNPGMLLKPGMFAQVELAAPARAQAVTVPVSAVIDSGTRRIVLVQAKEGRYEPREVKLGVRSDDYVEVVSGVKEGEQVVVTANFLIDAESNLKAAVGGFGQPEAAKPAAAAGHKADGVVDAVDPKAGTVSIKHQPVASLGWPSMTMEFKLANESLAQGLKPGAAIAFEFVERGQGEWVVTSVKPAEHAGHK
jgi:RND family efflux transporter MFP subunit